MLTVTIAPSQGRSNAWYTVPETCVICRITVCFLSVCQRFDLASDPDKVISLMTLAVDVDQQHHR